MPKAVVPAFKVVPPLYVLAPERVTVLVPVRVRSKGPLMGAEMVRPLPPVSNSEEAPKLRLLTEDPARVSVPFVPARVRLTRVIGAVRVTGRLLVKGKLASLPWVQTVFAPESTVVVQLGVVVSQFPETVVPGMAPSGSQNWRAAGSDRGMRRKERTIIAEEKSFFIM